MIETHPFAPFVPQNAKVLIVGSFPGKEQTQKAETDLEWFYGAKRNQFWPILRAVYGAELQTVASKKELFCTYGIAIADVFLKIRRRKDNNLDTNLEIIAYNEEALAKILEKKSFEAICFTSKFVASHFMKIFPETDNGIYLPSPSPRFARMRLEEKIEFYRAKLPPKQ